MLQIKNICKEFKTGNLVQKALDNVLEDYYNVINDNEASKTQEVNKMYETVKVVKGYEIKRMKGTRGAYHVNVREGKGFREFHTFRTIKAAAEFIETTL